MVEWDALGIRAGVVLIQEGKPFAYLSKGLKRKELSLSTYKKELLALVMTKQR